MENRDRTIVTSLGRLLPLHDGFRATVPSDNASMIPVLARLDRFRFLSTKTNDRSATLVEEHVKGLMAS
jgi:hypothetical protein